MAVTVMVEMLGILKHQRGILKHQMSVVKNQLDIPNDQDIFLKLYSHQPTRYFHSSAFFHGPEFSITSTSSMNMAK